MPWPMREGLERRHLFRCFVILSADDGGQGLPAVRPPLGEIGCGTALGRRDVAAERAESRWRLAAVAWS
jgi:hypothetical protein